MNFKDSPFTKPLDKWRVITPNGYKFDRRIFIGLTILLVIGAFVGFYYGGMPWERKVYLHCPTNTVGGICDNPLYHKCAEWYCQQETLPAGFQYGEPPGKLYDYYLVFTLFLCAASLVLNHFLLNKGFDFPVDGDE